jgi:hypothetical protein
MAPGGAWWQVFATSTIRWDRSCRHPHGRIPRSGSGRTRPPGHADADGRNDSPENGPLRCDRCTVRGSRPGARVGRLPLAGCLPTHLLYDRCTRGIRNLRGLNDFHQHGHLVDRTRLSECVGRAAGLHRGRRVARDPVRPRGGCSRAPPRIRCIHASGRRWGAQCPNAVVASREDPRHRSVGCRPITMSVPPRQGETPPEPAIRTDPGRTAASR